MPAKGKYWDLKQVRLKRKSQILGALAPKAIGEIVKYYTRYLYEARRVITQRNNDQRKCDL